MRRWLLNLLTLVAVGVGVAGAGVWIAVGRETVFLHSDFSVGRYDGDRAWDGWYLAVSRGHLAFEREQIRYATRPTTAPAGRWAAEDAVGIATPALRSFPFRGTLGFHFRHAFVVNEYGSLRMIRVGLPLWAVVGAAVVVVAMRVGRVVRGRRRRLRMASGGSGE